MNSGMFRIFLFCFVTSALAQGQIASEPALKADLARYYFASEESEIAARTELTSALRDLKRFSGKPLTAHALVQELRSYELVLRTYRRHAGYLHLVCALDRKGAACEADDRLAAELNANTAFVTPQLLSLSPKRLREFYATAPELSRYKFAIEEMRRDAGHVLPTDEEALLDSLAPQIGDWQYRLYEQVVSKIPFGTVQTQSGPLDVIRQRSALAANPDEHVREEAFKRRMDGFASQRELLAFALLHLVKAKNALAEIHHFQNAPARKYTSLSLDPIQTRQLLDQMAQNGELAKRLEKVRAHDFQEAYGHPMQVWDFSAPEMGFTPPITPLNDMAAIFHAAFAGLGPEYQAQFDALIDPRNGRADIVPGGARDRYIGGFSVGSTDSQSMLFFGRYDGRFKDLSVIAHEGGHAVHRALMSANHVAPIYAQGPHFLFESFAVFNELLLADYMADHAADPRLRRYYREQWLRIKGLDAFYGAQDALLEQKIYDGVSTGSVRTADDLDRITEEVDKDFSIFPGAVPELRNRWATLSLMYEDPLYDINYVYGGLLALKYYQLYLADPKEFAPRYVQLLRNGFDAPAPVLLKRFLNIDLDGRSLLADDVPLLERRLRELEEPADIVH